MTIMIPLCVTLSHVSSTFPALYVHVNKNLGAESDSNLWLRAPKRNII